MTAKSKKFILTDAKKFGTIEVQKKSREKDSGDGV
jgi:hypothetical protein